MLRFRFVSENLQFVADFRRCGGGVYAPNAPPPAPGSTSDRAWVWARRWFRGPEPFHKKNNSRR